MTTVGAPDVANQARRASRVFEGLDLLARRNGWQSLPPYLEQHLAEHADDAGELGRLLSEPDALDHIDQRSLVGLTARRFLAQTDQPAGASEVLSVGTALAAASPAQRRSLRTFAAARLGHSWTTDSGLVWIRGPLQSPHLTLTGHTSGVWSVCSVVLADGRVLLVSASRDRTVRLWDPDTGLAVGVPLVRRHAG